MQGRKNHSNAQVAIEKYLANPSDLSEDLERFEVYRITAETPIPKAEPIITIGNAAVATEGNLTVISGPVKTGKSAVIAVLLAGAITETDEVDGFRDLRVAPNIRRKAVIHLDTEQAAADQKDNVITAIRRAGLIATPPHFLSYNFRQLRLAEYQEHTEEICRGACKAFHGIHMILIDGVADFLASVNDEEKSVEIIQYFTHLAIKYACPVVIVIHSNPGTEKERGHLGSYLQRKCYALLTVSREGDTSTLAAKMLRKARFTDVPLIQFRFDGGKGYHSQMEGESPPETVQKKELQKYRDIVAPIFRAGIALKHVEAVTAIMKATAKSERTAKTMINNMVEWRLISKGSDNCYRLNS